MQIYLVRHGQTNWNREFLIQGRIDNSLNETGEKEAKNIAKYFEYIKPDKLITSPLKRAKQTLDIISELNNWDIEYIKEDLLVEREFGDLEGTDALKYRKIKDFSIFKNYETDSQLETRVAKVITKIINENKESANIIMMCHSHVMKAFLKVFFEHYDYEFKLKNCAIIKVNIKERVIKNIKID